VSHPTRRGVLLLLVAALFAAGIGGVFKATHALRPLENSSVDKRFALRGTQPAPSDVVIVGIDDATLDKSPGRTFPLNRKRDAKVIGTIAGAGAKVIADDIPYTTQSEDGDADNALIEAVRRASPRVVLGTSEVAENGETGIFGGAGKDGGLPYSKATPANTTLISDSDSRVRRFPFVLRHLTSLPMVVAAKFTGHKIATPGGNSARIDFPGPAGTIKELSFADVEKGRFPADAFRGKIVVIGPTASGLGFAHTTTTSRSMSQPEIEAASIATALAGFRLHSGSSTLEWLFALALGLVAPLVALRFRLIVALGAGLVAVAAFLFYAQRAFDHGTIVSVVPPLAGAVAGLLATALVANGSAGWLQAIVRWATRGGGRTQRVRAQLLLGAMAAIVVFVFGLQAIGALSRMEYSTVNERFAVRGTQPAPSNIVLVAIDDKSFQLLQAQWPFPRTLHAAVIRNLTKAGAKVIAYDVQFTEPSTSLATKKLNQQADEDLVDAVHDGKNIVMATTEVGELGDTKVFGSADDLAYSGATAANSNYLPDSDGRIRHMLFRIDNLETFAMAAARLYSGTAAKPPTGKNAWVDFAGPPETVKQLSFGDVEKGNFPASAVRGKIVVVGATAPSLHDYFTTATTRNSAMAGAEVHANAIETALHGFPLRNPPAWLDALLVIALAVITPFAGLRLGVFKAVGLGVVAIVALLVSSQLAFDDGTVLTMVYPLTAGLLAILATAAIHGVTVAFEREQTRDAFARFVPESVVDQVLKGADGLRLGGVRREGTVMFSDLRGFTSFSETLEPERVIESLNMYLTEMSDAILNHGGTLVAYMGDGIMAVFGAPLVQADHADRALEAAREMLDRMETYNDWLRGQGLTEDGFKMGIGLNSGPVMSGNVGSERRLEYTALGDTTNTAARLEGMTKGTPHQLYVADTTRGMLTRPTDDLVAVGEAEVRGRKAKVLLWSLAEAPAPEEAPAEAAPEPEPTGAPPSVEA
jgi:adenylate cyclase